MAGTLQHDDDDGGVISAINVTPLVDVALVLLIIFIVTASLILRSTIPLELPRAKTSQESTAGLLTIAITKDGKLYINSKPASINDIPQAVADAQERLRQQGKPAEGLNAFVSADVGAQYGRFAEVVDRLREEKVVHIAMDTKPVKVEEPDK